MCYCSCHTCYVSLFIFSTCFTSISHLLRNANDTCYDGYKRSSRSLRLLKYLPQAGRPPALPVFVDSSLPPFPRSSVPAWTTTVRFDCQQYQETLHGVLVEGLTPKTLSWPISLTILSCIDPTALPWPSVLMFPRSPT